MVKRELPKLESPVRSRVPAPVKDTLLWFSSRFRCQPVRAPRRCQVSGGIFGKGFLSGTQSKLEFLPEHSTDFIFSAFGEEFGFLGTLILMLLYLFIALRGLGISIKATDNFGRILSGTISLTIFLYVIVNVGMVIGLLPVVGAPLPFMSYGGTSMVTLFASLGIVMSIKSHQRILRK